MVSIHTMTQAREKLGKITAAVRWSNEPALFTDHGEPAGILVSPEWYMSRRDIAHDPSLEELASLPAESTGV